MSNWFTRLFSPTKLSSQDVKSIQETARILTAQAPLAKPEPAPEPQLSCFVKGIIRSMETEPHEWVWGLCLEPFYQHSDTNIRIYYSYPWQDGSVNCPTVEFTPAERDAVQKGLTKYIIFPAEESERNRQARELKEAIQYFEPLGCPQEKTEESA